MKTGRQVYLVAILGAVTSLFCGGYAYAEASTPSSEDVIQATAEEDDVAVLQTDQGIIVIELHPEDAPHHVENFTKLVRNGFYDGTRFHRCIPRFMIQGGDPNTRTDERAIWGRGNPGYTINAEFNDRPHARGSVSMARSADINSAGSQFFICLDDARHLDGQYTHFGTVISGMHIADAISRLPKSIRNPEFPAEPATIVSATMMPRLKALMLDMSDLEPTPPDTRIPADTPVSATP